MQSFSVSELQQIIGLIKPGGHSVRMHEEKLLHYLETEEKMDMVCLAAQREDGLGRFFCLLLLQKGIGAVQSRGEKELERFVEKVERLIDTGVGCTERLEVGKMASLYSTLAVLFWPVKVGGFIEKVSSLLLQKSPLGVEIFKHFLGQIADSLDITEERRYELKKNVASVANDLFTIGLEKGITEEWVEALGSMCKLGIASNEVLAAFFGMEMPVSEGILKVVEEVSADSTGQVFAGVSAYLSRAYAEVKKSGGEEVSTVVECIAAFGNQCTPKSAQRGEYDRVVRECLVDAVGTEGVKDVVEGESVLGLLKVFATRAKGYLIAQNGSIHPKYSTESSEDIQTVLGEGNPSQLLLSLCNMHLCVGVSANDAIIRVLDVLGSAFPFLITDFVREYHAQIPLHANEVLLKHLVCPVRFSLPYLRLKQSTHREEYDAESVQSVDLHLGKECAAVREFLEGAQKKGCLDPEVVRSVYTRAVGISGYYSLDLAVTCGVLLERKDLVMHAIQGFKGKGIAAFVSAITKCPEAVKDVFGEFQRYFLEKEGDLSGEIDAITKVIAANASASVGKTKQGVSVKCASVNAVDLLGKEIVEKIYYKIDTASFLELRKTSKILPYLVETVHTAFIHKLWDRIKREMAAEEATGEYKNIGDIQHLLSQISAECGADEASVLYDIIAQREYSVRGVITGIKKMLETGKENPYHAQIESMSINMLVAVYSAHSEESVRASIVGLLSETPERISLMEEMYRLDLSEVHNVKEKRGVMKRALRRIEGMKEKQGALLQKQPKQVSKEDKWAGFTSLFDD
ncbi:hypothetical protein NECID01_0864 [Nematocida sp. AWRm77]|nr:hypothetical protein NECID01_0864 [Nematocida sp. AWRm77]